MNVLDRSLLRDAEAELQIPAAFIEKDWYSVQLLASVFSWDIQGKVQPIFGGGTALSKAYRLTHRFSEDIDIRLHPTAPLGRKDRSKLRESLLAALTVRHWQIEDVCTRNENQYFGLSIRYPVSETSSRLRPFLKLELVFNPLRLPFQCQNVSSFLSALTESPPEAPNIPCLALEEIAIEKLSALCWRPESEKASERRDLVRHLHDLACLSQVVRLKKDLTRILYKTIHQDLAPRVNTPQETAIERLRSLPATLASYGGHYAQFVSQTSYAPDAMMPPDFEQALIRLDELLTGVL